MMNLQDWLVKYQGKEIRAKSRQLLDGKVHLYVHVLNEDCDSGDFIVDGDNTREIEKGETIPA